MEVLACLNGEIMPVEQARVPVWDRGFLFGDAVYEVWRMYRGRRWLEPEHIARLRAEPEGARIPPGRPGTVDGTCASHAWQASGIEEGTVYVQITRGVAPRAHAFPDPPVPPTELIIVRPYDDGPTAASRETESAVDQPSRSALEALRRQDRPTCWETCWRSKPLAGPVARKPCWWIQRAWSPRRRIRRSSGCVEADWRGRRRGTRSCRE